MTVHMHDIKGSSTCLACGHDAEKDEMHVTFASGGTYVYSGVSAALHRELMEAPSAGRFLHHNIKGKFPHRRMP